MHADELGRRERISALADGQLDDDEIAQTMAWVASSEEARATWHAYHVMGDALRSADLAVCSGDRDFAARLRERLARIDARAQGAAVASMPPRVAQAMVRSANDAAQRWKWLAAAASVVAVAVLGWQVGTVGTAEMPQLAARPAAAEPQASAATVPSGADSVVMLRDPKLDELLAAHRRFGGTTALQTPSGFLRNATFEQPGR